MRLTVTTPAQRHQAFDYLKARADRRDDKEKVTELLLQEYQVTLLEDILRALTKYDR